jgi:hypothetical protein
MEFALEKPYVSPKLDEREMDIRVRVRNCRGEPVFDRYHGQVVIFPRRTERGELRPTKGFPQDFVVTENLVLLEITGEEGGSVTYTLREGLEPGFDLFQAKTCGIDVVQTVEERTSVALVEEQACWRGMVDITVDRSFRETKKSDPAECGRDESELIVELHAHIWGELLLRPGQPATILSQDFSGTYEMTIRTFRESCVTTCRRKGVRGEVPVRPGSWESSETRVCGTLSDRDFRVSASAVVDRKTGQYRFLWVRRPCLERFFGGPESIPRRLHRGTRETSTASLETELERFEMSSSEIQGVTPNLKVVKGEKVVEQPFHTGTAKYTWDFQRIPCGE